MNKYYCKFKQAAWSLDKVNPDELDVGIYLALSVIYETYATFIDWDKVDKQITKSINKAYEDGTINE